MKTTTKAATITRKKLPCLSDVEVPAGLAVLVHAAMPDRYRLPRHLAIAARMMPALLETMTAGALDEADGTDHYKIARAIESDFRAWSQAEDPLQAYYTDVEEIRRRIDDGRTMDNLTATEDLLDGPEAMFIDAGFITGIVYAYHALKGGT